MTSKKKVTQKNCDTGRQDWLLQLEHKNRELLDNQAKLNNNLVAALNAFDFIKNQNTSLINAIQITQNKLSQLKNSMAASSVPPPQGTGGQNLFSFTGATQAPTSTSLPLSLRIRPPAEFSGDFSFICYLCNPTVYYVSKNFYVHTHTHLLALVN